MRDPLDTPSDTLDLVERAGAHLAERQATEDVAEVAREAARSRLPSLLDDVREVAALAQTAFGVEALQPATLVLAAPDRWRDEMRARAVLAAPTLARKHGQVMAAHDAPSRVDHVVLNLSTGVLTLDRPHGDFESVVLSGLFSRVVVTGSAVMLLQVRSSPWLAGVWLLGIVLPYAGLRYLLRNGRPGSVEMCDDPVGAVATLEAWLATWRGRLLATPGTPEAALPRAESPRPASPREDGEETLSVPDWG